MDENITYIIKPIKDKKDLKIIKSYKDRPNKNYEFVYILEGRYYSFGGEDLTAQIILKYPNLNRISKEKQPKIIRFTFGLSFILPASSRSDFRDDIEDIIEALKEENYKKWQIIGVVILNIISVLYHALLFKLSSYFYSSTKINK